MQSEPTKDKAHVDYVKACVGLNAWSLSCRRLPREHLRAAALHVFKIYAAACHTSTFAIARTPFHVL